MKLTSLKSLKLARPRLGQVLMPIAAITLGSGGSLVWANSAAGDAATAQHVPSEADQAVTALLKQRLPRTPDLPANEMKPLTSETATRPPGWSQVIRASLT